MAGVRNGRGAWYFVTVVVMAMAMAAVVTVESGGRLFGGPRVFLVEVGGGLPVAWPCGSMHLSMHLEIPTAVVTVGSRNDDEMKNM